MNLTASVEIVAFALCALIAVGGALGMATTMSMFRSGVFLMASFLGVAGLFILLSADLLGLLQIMMYIGGMLIMILFMVLFMPDPGGAQMAAMPEMMTPIERFFSLGLRRKEPKAEAPNDQREQEDEPQKEKTVYGDAADRHGDQDHGEMESMDGMDMSDMSMVTPVRAVAGWLAAAIAAVLIILLLLRPNWSLSGATPDPRSAQRLGALLMDKYMVGFEGAGFLILIGIFGAVFASYPAQHPDRRDRLARAAMTDAPPPVASDHLEPLTPPFDRGETYEANGGDRAGNPPGPSGSS